MIEGGVPDARLSVLVVDDHRTFSDLVALALDGQPDLRCVGTAHDAESGVALARELKPDIVVMDVQLGSGDGIEATSRITRDLAEVRVVVLTAHADRSLMRRAADAGACCLLAKNGSLPDMLAGLRSSRRGGFVVDPTLLRHLVVSPSRTRRRAPSLTPREHDVLNLLAVGRDTVAISRTLGISLNTCRGHVKSLLAKLDAHSQLEAVARARELDLVDAP